MRRDTLRRYGLTEIEYAELLDRGNGRCWICYREPKPGKHLHIDHDHKTRRIRGLLCWQCNHRLIGRHTDSGLFELAAKYLRQQTDWFVPARHRRTKRVKMGYVRKRSRKDP